jgi:hypothetical protein
MRRKAYALAKDFGLDRQDRISLSNMILQMDHDSWDHLSDTQLGRVLDALEGYRLVKYLLDHDDHGRVHVA